MSALTAAGNAVLALLPTYGYAVVGLSAFAGAAGIPLPSSVLLLAAGALCAAGTLAPAPAIAVALLAALLGDCVAYGLGRLAGGSPAGHRARRWLSVHRLGAAQRAVDRWGGGAVWLTRWLFTAVKPPLSVLAGTRAYPFGRFVCAAAAGEMLWATGYLALGWLAGGQAPAARTLVATASQSLMR